MAIYTSIITGGSNNHQTTSEEVNAIATDFVDEGVIGAITNTSGVAPATGAFAVNAQGTPDATVAVTSGFAYVDATPTGQAAQTFRVELDANQNVTINSNTSGSTKYDWIYIAIDADNAADSDANASNVASLTTSRSTSATTDDGTPPTYGYPIAVVTVANGFTTITNGNISDSRARAAAAQDSSVTGAKLGTPVAFGATLSADQTGIADASQTVVQADSESYDYGNVYDPSTYTFTAPYNGIYFFAGFIRMTGTNISDAYIEIYVNGTTTYSMGRLSRTVSSATQLLAGLREIKLDAGDTVTYRTFINVGSGTATVESNDTYWSCRLVGRID